jgi:hypothetical protein
MKVPNRDLLVLVKDEYMNEQAIEQEVEKLNEILYNTESIENFCVAHEVVDMNRYKILVKNHQVRKVIQQRILKPFEFLFNKN